VAGGEDEKGSGTLKGSETGRDDNQQLLVHFLCGLSHVSLGVGCSRLSYRVSFCAFRRSDDEARWRKLET
jgi:hypothetical protein